MARGFYYDDNYISLVKGETREIKNHLLSIEATSKVPAG